VLHRLQVLLSLATNFSSREWGANGPLRLDGVLRARCLAPAQPWPAVCGDVAILPQSQFYAINWRQVEQFFRPAAWPGVAAALEGSLGAHLWGRWVAGGGRC
jgi:hypothetical protein